jgi:hypothetical protein
MKQLLQAGAQELQRVGAIRTDTASDHRGARRRKNESRVTAGGDDARFVFQPCQSPGRAEEGETDEASIA